MLEINIKQSINTDTINEDFRMFDEPDTGLLVNTGIERNGGITNIYETKETYAEAGEHIITTDGKKISLVSSSTADYKTVKIDGNAVGQVSSYGISTNIEITEADDVFLTDTGYVTCSLADSTITIREYDLSQTLLNTRVVTFANLSSVLQLFTSLSFVKWNGQKYSDSLEWSLRLGDQVVILQESNPSISITQAIQSVSVIGTNNINATIVYQGQLIVAGAGGRIGSYDGANWKNFDGTGIGSGLYQAGDASSVIGTNDITAMCVYTYGSVTYLIIAGTGGRVGSFDGAAWIPYTSGTGIASSTVVSTDNISCMTQMQTYLIICGKNGKMGSWNGSAWTLYNDGTAGAVCDNATIAGTSITSCYPFTDIEGNKTLVLAGTGQVGSMKIQSGVSWNTTTSVITSNDYWKKVSYGNGVWVAVANNTTHSVYGEHSIARSIDNGKTWVTITTLLPGGYGWSSVVYGNGVWIAVSDNDLSTANRSIAVSSDKGTTWQFINGYDYRWINIVYGNGIFIAFTLTGAVYISNDNGSTWNNTTMPAAVLWNSAAYGSGSWVMVSDSTSTTQSIATSSNNGASWGLVSTPVHTYGWSTVSWGNNQFVATTKNPSSTNQLIALSNSGSSWAFTTNPFMATVKEISYGNGSWLITVDSANVCARSFDNGVTWSMLSLPYYVNNYVSCSYGNGTWVMLLRGMFQTHGIIYSNIGTYAAKNICTSSSNRLYPTNIASFMGVVPIYAIIQKTDTLVFAGGGASSCMVGAFVNNNSWIEYNSGFGLSDNNTLIPGVPITEMVLFQGSIIVSGGNKIACFYNDNSKHAASSGLALTNNGTIVGSSTINSLTPYDVSPTVQVLFIGATAGVLNNMDSTGAFTPFYTAGATQIANLLEGFNSLGYLYTYRYENGEYVINLVANSLNKSYTLNNSTKEITIFTASNLLLQVSGNLSRHICTAFNTTARPLYDATNIKAAGLIGYTDFANYSNVVVYPVCVYTLSGILSSQATWGYSDLTFKQTSSATNVFNYVSQFRRDPAGLFTINQSNSDTLVNAYGKLTNNIGVKPVVPFEWRVNTINSTPSYFSIALLDSISTDTLGVIITNVGAINDVYQPEIHTDDTLLYQNDLGAFIILKVTETPSRSVQQVSDFAYKINTLSPLNIIDTETSALEIGSVDYNNRMMFTSLVAPTTSTKIASFIQGKYSNSIDTGDKLVTIINPTSSNIQIIGFRIPIVSTSFGDYSVDTYVNDIYSFSTLNSGSELVINSKTDTIYVASTFIPPAIGSVYSGGTTTANGVTIFLKPDYDGYSIGNDIKGVYTLFRLYGQVYLFDGKHIYNASVDDVTGIFIGKNIIAPAVGLQYIASAPTVIYFYSNFDNSIYTFTGGRSLEKYKRFNAMPKINKGIYSVVDNTVLFDTDTSFIWIRDSIISENQKGIDQTNLKYYDTTEGLCIGNNVSNWQYTYESKPGSTVVPLTLRTPFYGFNTNMKSVLSKWCITLYNPAKPAMTVKGTCYTIDEDISKSQDVVWTINPKDYNDEGYVRIRLQPQIQKTLGISLKIEITTKILILAIYPEFKEAEGAVTTTARSR